MYQFFHREMAFSWEKHIMLMTFHYATLAYLFQYSFPEIICLEILYAITFMMMVANT